MPELLAGRFLASGRGWIDVATGEPAQVHVFDRASDAAQLVWNDWCATVACMRHPTMQTLIDYGAAGPVRAFEAYTLRGPLAVRRATACSLLAQAAAFLEWRGVHMSPATGRLLMRAVIAGGGVRRRALGVILQPRAALRQIEDALREAAPGGVSPIVVAGERGAGLRTLRVQVARVARVLGYVPLSARLVADAPWLASLTDGRHVCLLVGPGAIPHELAAASRLASRLGLGSARRHLLVRFTRAASKDDRALLMDRMGVTAMVSMIFTPRDRGLDHEALVAAARRADGMPGRYLEQLGAGDRADTLALASIAHESPVPYAVGEPAAARTTRPAARSLGAASARAVRLSVRGRHAAAARLLTRAARVLELRGDRRGAAGCADTLGWQLRDRGKLEEGLAQVARARELAPEYELRAAIAVGIIRTDECRFVEAEAALRGAVAAAGLAGDARAIGHSRLALARCLHWSGRTDEALAQLEECGVDATLEVEVLALRARLLIARGDVRAAAAIANAAFERADPGDLRSTLRAARAMASVSLAVGDRVSARAHARRALHAASAAHLPLFTLRLRALLASLDDDTREHARRRLEGRLGSALARLRVPPLVRRELDAVLDSGGRPSPSAIQAPQPSTSLAVMQEFLELAFSAEDDDAGIAAVLDALLRRLHAATIEVVAAGHDRRTLGQVGRPWTGDRRVLDRALAGAPAARSGLPAEAAHPILHAGRPIGALVCRWTATAPAIPDADAVLHSAALALAPAVRARLERVPAPRDAVWPELIGESLSATRLREAVIRAARAPFPVLVEGESGSGKELVARAIHRLSPRRDRRLCAVNCAALSEDLLEAELFGHVRGAFTGAVGERAGLFEEADGGSIFLDEVGELSQRAQAKLLRVLQDGEVRRVGENFARRVDARVIAATNRRLDSEVEAGRFRADLRFRLDVVRIAVPPLRDRADDVPLLAAQFWEDAARRVGSRAVLGADVVHALARYEWPGNVRQLQNVIASLAVHAPRRGRVPASLLPAQIARTAGDRAQTFEAAREEFERRFVAAELARAGGHRARAARALGVTRQGLAKMLRRLGLDDPRTGQGRQ